MSVFHLKYRPQNWSEMDLADVSSKIKKILAQDETIQSFLFTGPKGAGKTSAARILAKAINCENPKNGEPCNNCEQCREIDRGASLDVIEIDAASNRGIEDVRALKDKAYLLPVRLQKKVFIIDEVHMLTREAFNALLKLLEEPPEQTMFVLCTTEAGKIPETVLSRLTRIDFHKGNKSELEKSLERIIRGEGIEIEREALDEVLSRSDGSFRNLQRLFNEMVMALGKKITAKEANNYLSKGEKEYDLETLEADLAGGKTKIILKRLEEMAEVGVDFREFRERAISFFQKNLVEKVSGKGGTGMTLPELSRWLNLLIAAGKQEKDISVPQLPLELAVVEFLGAGKDDNDDNGPKEKKVEKKAAAVKVSGETKAAPAGSSGGPKEVKIISDEVFEEPVVNLETVAQNWNKLLEAVKPYNHSVEAFLRAARPLEVKGRTIVMEVFYPFHKDKLEEVKNREIVEAGLKQIWGKALMFCCVLGKDKKPALVINNETPMEKVSGQLADEKKDIYDVAKEIFG